MTLRDYYPKLVGYYRRLVPEALRRQRSPAYTGPGL